MMHRLRRSCLEGEVLAPKRQEEKKEHPGRPQREEKRRRKGGEEEERKKRGKRKTQNPTVFSPPKISYKNTAPEQKAEPPESHQLNVRARAPKPSENNPLERENSKNRG